MSSPLDDRESSVTSALADTIVAIVRRYTGRGATRARTIVADDVVTVVLEDLLTRGEQALVERGRGDDVMRMRRAYREAMSDDLRRAVEQIVGRRVVALMGANHIVPDYSAEIFVLGDTVDVPA